MSEEIYQNIYPSNKQFAKDLVKANLPFELIQALTSVVIEIVGKKFKYKKLSEGTQALLIFDRAKKERVIITVSDENLLIRQFDLDGENRTLKVIYVAKPSQRYFKLL